MNQTHAPNTSNALELQTEFAQFLQVVSQFFNQDRINDYARETRFVERESKLTGHLFLSLFTFGMSVYGTPSLAQLLGLLNDVKPEIELSRQALHDRINEEAVAFFEKMLALAIEIKLPQRLSEQMRAAVCPHFNGIRIFDSTSFQLPEALAEYFRGARGDGSKAAVKIFFGYDFNACRFLYRLASGTTPDQTALLGLIEDIQAGDLSLEDLGYFNLEALTKIDQKGAFFLSRLLSRVTLYQRTADGTAFEKFNLVKFVQCLSVLQTEVEVYLKWQSTFTKTRLVIEKAPQEVKAKRLRKTRKNNKRRGHKLTKRTKILAGFNLYITNAPATAIPREFIRVFYGIRWQVELMFKIWKSNFALATVTGKKPERIRCLLYAKLLFISITSTVSMAIRNVVWLMKRREVSLDQAAKHFKTKAQTWLKAIIQAPEQVAEILQTAAAFIMKHNLKGKSRKRVYPLALLENMISLA